LQKGIVPVYGDPLIAADRLTVPGLLKQHGYHTACIGKWHLGQGWDFEPDKETFYPYANYSRRDRQADIPGGATPALRDAWKEAFSKPTTGGPTTRGFDYYFGVDIPNWPPYCFI
jgi:arylsulfatase A-like enzyme